MNDGPARLRRHLAAHNWHVLATTTGSFAVVLALWAVVYVLGYWLVLVAITLGDPMATRVPAGYPIFFAVLMAGTVGVTAIARWGRPVRRPRDGLRWSRVALDFLLMLPRATIGAAENVTAFQRLSRRERERAWAFLQRFEDQRYLPISALALEIPHPHSRERILRALQFTGLIELRERDGEWVFGLHSRTARRLLGPRFALR